MDHATSNIKRKIKKKKNYHFKKKNKINKNKRIKNTNKNNLKNFENITLGKLDEIKEENFEDKKLLKLKEFEINGLDYQEAIKLDKRKFCQYYYFLLKYNHPISFSFACYNDYSVSSLFFYRKIKI